jgi:hypothetical protein
MHSITAPDPTASASEAEAEALGGSKTRACEATSVFKPAITLPCVSGSTSYGVGLDGGTSTDDRLIVAGPPLLCLAASMPRKKPAIWLSLPARGFCRALACLFSFFWICLADRLSLPPFDQL